MSTPNDHEDTSSIAGSYWTASSSSTVPGPGAISGKFLKAIGETALDLVVSVIIRTRLRAIRRTIETDPEVLRNPLGEKEVQRANQIFEDLEEICRPSAGDYYSASLRTTAANLIWRIAIVKRQDPYPGTVFSPTSTEQWEKLLTQVKAQRLLVDGSTPTTTYADSTTVEMSEISERIPKRIMASIQAFILRYISDLKHVDDGSLSDPNGNISAEVLDRYFNPYALAAVSSSQSPPLPALDIPSESVSPVLTSSTLRTKVYYDAYQVTPPSPA